MYCDLWLQYIQVRKLFKGGNYSRAETIRGNTVNCINPKCFASLFLADSNGRIINEKLSLRTNKNGEKIHLGIRSEENTGICLTYLDKYFWR